MSKVHDWRVIDRFETVADPAHGYCWLLLYNTHQPASDNQSFPQHMTINLCNAVILDAIRHKTNADNNVGFAFGGNANCNLGLWQLAFDELPERHLTFENPQYMSGVNKKIAISWLVATFPACTSCRTRAPFKSEMNNTVV